MVKLNNIIFAVIGVFASFISASSITDEKHCAPRACCGCPGNGKSKVKALMNIFLGKIAECNHDAFQLVSANTATMDELESVACTLNEESILDFFQQYFPCGSIISNVEFDYIMLHDGSIEVHFLAVVTMSNSTTKAYNMKYLWTQDAQCNWHISRIFGVDTVCLLEVIPGL